MNNKKVKLSFYSFYIANKVFNEVSIVLDLVSPTTTTPIVGHLNTQSLAGSNVWELRIMFVASLDELRYTWGGFVFYLVRFF